MSPKKQTESRRRRSRVLGVRFYYSDKVSGPRALPRPPPSPPSSQPLKMVWPRRILSLDIETATCTKVPEKNEIAIVGVKLFVRKQGQYVRGPYVAYRRSELKNLERRLRRFRGLIIGHNIFNFDYRVLRTEISLEGVIEKTVDTLWLTRQRTKRRSSDLSLDGLAQENFDTGKLIDGEKIPVLWKQGDEKLVIRHNKKDCDLTMRIWQRIVEQGFLAAPDSQRGTEYLRFSDDDSSVLGGQASMITQERWLEEVDGDSAIFKRQPLAVRFVDDVALQPDCFKLFNRVTCMVCCKKFILISDVKRVFRKNEVCECPHCTASTTLDGVDTLRKAGVKKLIFIEVDRPGRPEDFPDENEARTWLTKKMRFGRWA